jgi:hypothetical protein
MYVVYTQKRAIHAFSNSPVWPPVPIHVSTAHESPAPKGLLTFFKAETSFLVIARPILRLWPRPSPMLGESRNLAAHELGSELYWCRDRINQDIWDRVWANGTLLSQVS